MSCRSQQLFSAISCPVLHLIIMLRTTLIAYEWSSYNYASLRHTDIVVAFCLVGSKTMNTNYFYFLLVGWINLSFVTMSWVINFAKEKDIVYSILQFILFHLIYIDKYMLLKKGKYSFGQKHRTFIKIKYVNTKFIT